MEEELNENELEERLYAMLYYGDETQDTENISANREDVLRFVENAPRSTVRRYWRTSDDSNTPYQKINAPKDTTSTPNDKNTPKTVETSKPKDEKCDAPPTPLPSVDLDILQSPVPKNIQKTIEIIESDEPRVVELETSDDDEVIEIALPPKPTITIESSDEDELCNTTQTASSKDETNVKTKDSKITSNNNSTSTSPVPSVVSSVSDDFIRGDCIALNISSRRPDNHSFDFSLHGSDLLDKTTPSKKKKKKKNKEQSTPVAESTPKASATNTVNEYFATPKSKAKDKRQKNKSYSVSDKSIPNADIYDSDSNQSIIDTNKNQNSYIVTEKSLPSADVYDSDSSEIIKSTGKAKQSTPINSKRSDGNVSLNNRNDENLKYSKRNDSTSQVNDAIVDLTDDIITLDDSPIKENFYVANVTGFQEAEDYEDEPIVTKNATGHNKSLNDTSSSRKDTPKLGSTKVPAILYEDLDFDNLKGKDKVCRWRRYSLTTLRAEMEKFYNESWGGEDFNHREIQKYMSRDKSLWVIDPKDRMPSTNKRKIVCNYCNRAGHRDDTCRMKPPVCHMCGSTGHYEPRCPSKICVNCGSPNYVYSTICHNCASWGRLTCPECGQKGHPSSHCPDTWRRYHNTIDDNTPLEENRQTKRHDQLFCSGCTRRGHLVHTCRLSLPFSGLPINSPYVTIYRPIYASSNQGIPQASNNNQKTNKNTYNTTISQDSSISSVTTPSRLDRNKRQSKSPTAHENHVNKKRSMSVPDVTEESRNPKSPIGNNSPQKKTIQSKESVEDTNKNTKEPNKSDATDKAPNTDTEKAPDFIPISSMNHDKKGQIIQDNEVSDTSGVVTSARIYVTKEIIDKLKTPEGQDWLNTTMEKLNITVQHTDIKSFLIVKGKVGDQEAFQSELRDWAKTKPSKEYLKTDKEGDTSQKIVPEHSLSYDNIPKKRLIILKKLSEAFDSLKQDFGDPNAIYKEFTYLQNHHQQLLNQKAISPKQVFNNRSRLNEICRKLNMILIGQAGLADGWKHLNELHSMQERLSTFTQKNIPMDIRNEIGQHYHCIFTAIPRDDYVDLIQKYYVSKQSSPSFKKKKKNENSFKISPRPIQQRKFTSVPSQKVDSNIVNNANMDDGFIRCSLQDRKPLVERTVNKLVFYHRRVLHARPNDSVLKKTRLELARKLYGHIASLSKNAYMSSKTLKKVKKIQEQAQLFLVNA